MGNLWGQAVNLRCEKPGRKGVFLSGGLDQDDPTCKHITIELGKELDYAQLCEP